ncbi:MAG: GDSL-type esterase/lipase family protein [Bacteroidales bacterium]
MMKPYKTLLFLLTVFFLLTLLALVFPDNGVRVSPGVYLKFPKIREILAPEKIEYADISRIIEQSTAASSDTVENSMIDEMIDSVSEMSVVIDTVRANADSLRTNIYPIEFPGNKNEILYPFFRQLPHLIKQDRLIRILHYGDSQIEGDRMTSYIRYRLQKRFGGGGPGLLPAIQPYPQFNFRQAASSNWYRYTVFGKPDTTLGHNRYGAMAGFMRFAAANTDTSLVDTSRYNAWISFEPTGYGYRSAKKINYLRLFYGHNSKPFITQLWINEALHDAEIINATSECKYLDWTLDAVPEKIEFRFEGAASPDIYGVAMDKTPGIAVDNIPMRGSSGLVFSKMDRQHLKEMCKSLDVELVIMQFGGNVVPHITDDYSYYGRWLDSQFRTIRSVLPGVPVILIGVADMSMKENEKYVSYPNIEKIRDVMRKTAFENGHAYWDMYQAMGGKNSMPSWVFADPPLASTDFIHFNRSGARIMAEMFYNSFIFEYGRFLSEKGRKTGD